MRKLSSSSLRIIGVIKVRREDVETKKNFVLVAAEEDEVVLVAVEQGEALETLDIM